MRTLAFFTLLLLPHIGIFSQEYEVLNHGKDLLDKAALKKLKMTKDIGTFVTMTTNDSFYHKITTLTKPEFIHSLSVGLPMMPKKIKQGQPLLISFKAISLKSDLETNEAKINFMFRQTDSFAPSKLNAKSVSLAPHWQTYYLPFKALFDSDLKNSFLLLQFGYAPQEIEIKDIQLLVFPMDIDYTLLPSTKITYVGIEESAQWRIEAQKKIEENRKGDIHLQFYHNDYPLPEAEINIEHVSHHFRFGAAVNAEDVNNNPKHLQTITSLFNTIVFANDLKMKSWSDVKRRNSIIQAIHTLQLNGIQIKGHALLWPGFNYLPQIYKKNQNNPEKIQELIDEHFNSILKATYGKISHWDVLNEAYTNKDITQILKSDSMLFDIFNKAKSLDPNAKRYINEYGIISGGGINTIKQDWYYNFVGEIDRKTNGAIDGLGMQSHIGSDLTPPAKVMEILDRFETLQKEISISEFTIDITDDIDLQAQYTRDFMTAAFSNIAVKEFLFWGYYAPKSPKAPLIDENFALTKLGKVYYDLVFNQWTTRIKTKSNENGWVEFRGFYGKYKYTINHKGKVYKGTFELLPGTENRKKINIKL